MVYENFAQGGIAGIEHVLSEQDLMMPADGNCAFNSGQHFGVLHEIGTCYKTQSLSISILGPLNSILNQCQHELESPHAGI